VFRTLAAASDAVVNNLRGDQPAKLGLTYGVLKDVNARLVCGHLSGYGRSGERADWPAYDYLMQAEAGYLHLTGEPGTPPARMGLSMVDFMAGVTTAFAVTAALVGALKTGTGCDVDVTLYDVAMHQLTYPATWYLNERDVTARRPRSGHPSIVPCEMFPTADGWLFVMCVTPRFWALLCEALHRPELTQDTRFRNFPDRLANRDALVAILDAAFGEATSAEWMRRLAGKVPAAPVLALDEALDNPYFRGNGGVVTLAHPERGELSLVASPIRLDGTRPPAVAASPLGKDTESVLAQAGLTASEIRDLRTRGVI
jgi:crotonobetainyl-CoA:carnitine CoA-transferase CaiB-like acyl-CoA transferase